ncbi:acyltransferase [Halorubrum sp. SD626R]|uniref:acyltransferase n=1 Tax=Halorubrum sp. SD626R TaxID=1419722 RepID=UPI000B80FA23|nr:acyltransferase [Halorubrum sp. SD626R]TKX82264.1 N-acetyltransferase [Halorubrum sp. SD626R]
MSNVSSGSDCTIDERTTVGYEYDTKVNPTILGDSVTIRAGSTIYADVKIHDYVQTGHDVLIREQTEIGKESIIGTKTVIDGYSKIGKKVSLQTGVYIPSHTTIEDEVFIGPNAVLTNDPYPVRQNVDLEGPTVERSASIGANATINPEITVGERSFVASGAVVTEDVPADTLAVGVPAEFKPLPDKLQGKNDL